MRSIYTILIALLMNICCIFAQSDTYVQGMDALRNRDESKAMTLLQKSADVGIRSFDLFYNLGTLYLQSDDPIRAKLYYEKALKIEPRNKDLLQNIDYLNTNYPSEIRAIPSFFINRWFNGMATFFSSNQWFYISLFAMLLMLAAFYQWLLGKTTKSKKWGFTSFFICLFAFILTSSLAYRKHYLETNTDFAIQMKNRVGLYQGPDQNSERLLLLKGGEKVQIVDTYGDWTQVELQDREVGWLKSESLENI